MTKALLGQDGFSVNMRKHNRACRAGFFKKQFARETKSWQADTKAGAISDAVLKLLDSTGISVMVGAFSNPTQILPLIRPYGFMPAPIMAFISAGLTAMSAQDFIAYLRSMCAARSPEVIPLTAGAGASAKSYNRVTALAKGIGFGGIVLATLTLTALSLSPRFTPAAQEGDENFNHYSFVSIFATRLLAATVALIGRSRSGGFEFTDKCLGLCRVTIMSLSTLTLGTGIFAGKLGCMVAASVFNGVVALLTLAQDALHVRRLSSQKAVVADESASSGHVAISIPGSGSGNEDGASGARVAIPADGEESDLPRLG